MTCLIDKLSSSQLDEQSMYLTALWVSLSEGEQRGHQSLSHLWVNRASSLQSRGVSVLKVTKFSAIFQIKSHFALWTTYNIFMNFSSPELSERLLQYYIEEHLSRIREDIEKQEITWPCQAKKPFFVLNIEEILNVQDKTDQCQVR